MYCSRRTCTARLGKDPFMADDFKEDYLSEATNISASQFQEMGRQARLVWLIIKVCQLIECVSCSRWRHWDKHESIHDQWSKSGRRCDFRKRRRSCRYTFKGLLMGAHVEFWRHFYLRLFLGFSKSYPNRRNTHCTRIGSSLYSWSRNCL